MLDSRILDNLLKSRVFSDSQKSRQLLEYLFKKSSAGIIPHETDIAFDVFDRSKDFNPAEDTIVRVSMHKLRQKLNAYYATAGKRDKFRVVIPKGRYSLQVKKHHSTHHLKFSKAGRLLNIFLLGAVVLLTGLYFHQFQKIKLIKKYWNVMPQSHPVWREILTGEKPVIIAMGDLFILHETGPPVGYNRIIRDTRINSHWQFNRYLAEYPHLINKLEPHENFRYLPEYSYNALTDLMPHFILHNIDITIMSGSELNAEHFNRAHILYIGYFKTATPFHNLLQKVHFKADIENESLTPVRHPNFPDSTATPANDPQKHHTDVGYAAKLPGPNGNIIILMAGFRLTGVQGVVQNMTGPAELQELVDIFEKKSVPRYFEVVYLAEGFARSSITTKIIDYKGHDKNLRLWQ